MTGLCGSFRFQQEIIEFNFFNALFSLYRMNRILDEMVHSTVKQSHTEKKEVKQIEWGVGG